MDRFSAEKLRVTDALLETERQKAKILITSEKALDLRAHALASIESFRAVRSESEAPLDASQRKRHLRP